jgi:PKD repeat protein
MKLNLIILFLFVNTVCFSQVISHSIIYGSGQSFGLGNYRLGGTIGQPVISKDSNFVTLQNGFLQGDLLTMPTIKATNMLFSQVTDKQIRVTWNKGNGRKRILLARPTNAAFTLKPKHNFAYNANSQFGNGQTMGDGSYVVLNDTSNSCLVTNLSPSTNYYFTIVEYNYNGVLNWYDTLQTPIASQRTCPASIIVKYSNRICRYDSLHISGLSGIYSYTLLKDSIVMSSSNNNSFFLKENGIYRLRINDPINSCIATSPADTFIFKTINAGGDTSVNCGDSVMLMPSIISGAYQWSPSIGLSSSNASNPFVRTSNSTSYLLRVTDLESCTILDTINVTIYNKPLVSKQTFTMTCGDSSDVYTSLIYRGNYQWTPNIGIANSNSRLSKIAPFESRKYSVVVTDDIGCIRRDSVNVNVIPLTFKISSNSPITCGDSVTLQSTLHGNSIVNWLPNKALSSNVGFAIKCAPIKTTQYKATLTHLVGCVQSDSSIVNVLPFALSIQKTPANIICGDSMTLLATQYQNYQYAWMPDSFITSKISPATKVAPITSRFYNLEVSNPIGCIQNDSVWVQVNPFFHSSTGDASITCNDSIFIGSSLVTNAVYNWTPTSGLESPNQRNTWAYPSISTTYATQVTMPNGCAQVLPIKINVKQREFSTINDTSICRGQSIKLTTTTYINDIYTWIPAKYLDNATIVSPLATPDLSTEYIVKVLSFRGCENADTVKIAILNQAHSSFQFSLDSCYLGDSIQFLNQSTNANKYKWDFGDGTIDSNVLDPYHFYNNKGSVNVKLYALNTFTGCNDTLIKGLNIVSKPKSLYELVAYPNPASSYFYLNIISNKNQTIQIHLFDELGRVQKEFEYVLSIGFSTLSFPIDNIKNGLYYLQIVANGVVVPPNGNSEIQIPTTEKMRIVVLK